ncbi:MAG: hypothetical protein AB7O67_23310 [Vicinamibacterales bacterium]
MDPSALFTGLVLGGMLVALPVVAHRFGRDAMLRDAVYLIEQGIDLEEYRRRHLPPGSVAHDQVEAEAQSVGLGRRPSVARALRTAER